MNYEARLLRNKLRRVVKANNQRLREEREIAGLYQKIENQQTALLDLQERSKGLHMNLRTQLPFEVNGATKSTTGY